MWYNIYSKCLTNSGLLGEIKPIESREIMLLQQYINLFNNRFNYKNLPNNFLDITGKNKTFELMLFFSPAVAFFKDEVLGLQCLPVTGEWSYNIAGFPTKWKVFGCNDTGYKKELTEKNSVLMFNDYAFTVPYLHIIYNINYMIECDLTHKQNLKAQRQPMIYEIDEDEKKSAEKFEKKLNEFSDTIKVRIRLGDSPKSKGQPTTYNSYAYTSGRAFEGDKLASDYQYFHNRNLTIIGYNNENLEKRERMLVDEVNANNDVVNSYYTTAFNCRKEAIEKGNKMFNENIIIEPMSLVSVKEEIENADTPVSV